MITEVVMPSMGADMTEGAVARWLKKEGDPIKRGEILAEIETDKAVVEMEAYGSGVLRKIVVPEGKKVPVGQLIAFIGDPDDAIPQMAGTPAEARKAEAPPREGARPAPERREEAPAGEARAAAALAGPKPTAAPAETGERIKASPVARKLAEQHGLDLGAIEGTGPGGRITREDVEKAVAEAAAPAAEIAAAPKARPGLGETVPLTSMRTAIAKVTVRSKTQIPHFYVTASVDMTETMRVRQRLNEALTDEGVRVSVNDFVIKATVNALKKHGKFNSFFENDKLVGHDRINIGIAIALEAGLIVPAVLGCESKSLKQIALAAHDLGQRARGGKLTQEELTGGTFSISNLGMFDVEQFVAIIVPPQPGILAVGRVTKTPVVKNEQIVVGEVMKATVSIDHRVADGAEAAVFLGEIKKALENPVGLLV
ncbi:MAG: 2-oxo acid dehydrogenase subunit E2 [Chloroflexi bacterium]|nr:2-oxo acid dehydrogenase subunit E2 [Chloroflexota bacterium]